MYSDIPLPGFVPLKEPISISSNDDDDDIEQFTEDSEPMAVLPSPVPLRLSHSPAIPNQRKDVGVNSNARQKLFLDSKDNEVRYMKHNNYAYLPTVYCVFILKYFLEYSY